MRAVIHHLEDEPDQVEWIMDTVENAILRRLAFAGGTPGCYTDSEVHDTDGVSRRHIKLSDLGAHLLGVGPVREIEHRVYHRSGEAFVEAVRGLRENDVVIVDINFAPAGTPLNGHADRGIELIAQSMRGLADSELHRLRSRVFFLSAYLSTLRDSSKLEGLGVPPGNLLSKPPVPGIIIDRVLPLTGFLLNGRAT